MSPLSADDTQLISVDELLETVTAKVSSWLQDLPMNSSEFFALDQWESVLSTETQLAAGRQVAIADLAAYMMEHRMFYLRAPANDKPDANTAGANKSDANNDTNAQADTPKPPDKVFKEAVEEVRMSPEPTSSSLGQRYDSPEEISTLDDLVYLLLPIYHIQEEPALVFTTLDREWDQLPPRVLATYVFDHGSPSQNDPTTMSTPPKSAHILGFSTKGLRDEITGQDTEHSHPEQQEQQQDGSQPRPVAWFPFFSVEIKADDSISMRIRNLHNSGTMLRELYVFAKAAAEAGDGSVLEDFFGKPRAFTVGIAAEFAELFCHWPVPDEDQGLRSYGRLVDFWPLGKEAVHYVEARRTILNAMEIVKADNLTLVKRSAAKLGWLPGVKI